MRQAEPVAIGTRCHRFPRHRLPIANSDTSESAAALAAGIATDTDYSAVLHSCYIGLLDWHSRLMRVVCIGYID